MLPPVWLLAAMMAYQSVHTLPTPPDRIWTPDEKYFLSSVDNTAFDYKPQSTKYAGRSAFTPDAKLFASRIDKNHLGNGGTTISTEVVAEFEDEDESEYETEDETDDETEDEDDQLQESSRLPSVSSYPVGSIISTKDVGDHLKTDDVLPPTKSHPVESTSSQNGEVDENKKELFRLSMHQIEGIPNFDKLRENLWDKYVAGSTPVNFTKLIEGARNIDTVYRQPIISALIKHFKLRRGGTPPTKGSGRGIFSDEDLECETNECVKAFKTFSRERNVQFIVKTKNPLYLAVPKMDLLVWKPDPKIDFCDRDVWEARAYVYAFDKEKSLSGRADALKHAPPSSEQPERQPERIPVFEPLEVILESVSKAREYLKPGAFLVNTLNPRKTVTGFKLWDKFAQMCKAVARSMDAAHVAVMPGLPDKTEMRAIAKMQRDPCVLGMCDANKFYDESKARLIMTQYQQLVIKGFDAALVHGFALMQSKLELFERTNSQIFGRLTLPSLLSLEKPMRKYEYQDLVSPQMPMYKGRNSMQDFLESVNRCYIRLDVLSTLGLPLQQLQPTKHKMKQIVDEAEPMDNYVCPPLPDPNESIFKSSAGRNFYLPQTLSADSSFTAGHRAVPSRPFQPQEVQELAQAGAFDMLVTADSLVLPDDLHEDSGFFDMSTLSKNPPFLNEAREGAFAVPPLDRRPSADDSPFAQSVQDTLDDISYFP